MKIYKFAWKFTKNGTYICELCKSPLLVLDITSNPNHHFTNGQLLECSCGQSKVWTNSIRFPESLLAWCNGEEVPHHQNPTEWGFCNDEFCPYCWEHFACLKNGYKTNDGYWDKYGCRNCKQNQFALMGIGTKLGEMEGQEYLARWYKSHRNMWENKIFL